MFSCEICEISKNTFSQKNFGGCFYSSKLSFVLRQQLHDIQTLIIFVFVFVNGNLIADIFKLTRKSSGTDAFLKQTVLHKKSLTCSNLSGSSVLQLLLNLNQLFLNFRLVLVCIKKSLLVEEQKLQFANVFKFLFENVFNNFAIFTGIHLCWNFFLNKVPRLMAGVLLLNNDIYYFREFMIQFGISRIQ